jgi:hypothetical protein
MNGGVRGAVNNFLMRPIPRGGDSIEVFYTDECWRRWAYARVILVGVPTRAADAASYLRDTASWWSIEAYRSVSYLRGHRTGGVFSTKFVVELHNLRHQAFDQVVPKNAVFGERSVCFRDGLDHFIRVFCVDLV